MSKPIFSIQLALLYGWKLFKRELPYFIKLFIILALFYGIQDFASEAIHLVETHPNIYYMLLLVNFLIAYVVIKRAIQMGILKSSIRMNRRGHGQVADIIQMLPKLLKYIIASMSYAFMMFLGVMAGMIPSLIIYFQFYSSLPLLILAMVLIPLALFPAAYVAVRWGFMEYLIVDSELRVVDCFKKSTQMTRGTKWYLFLWGLLLVSLMVLSVIPVFAAMKIFFGTWYNFFELRAWQRWILSPLSAGFLIVYPMIIAGKGYVYQQYYEKYIEKKDEAN